LKAHGDRDGLVVVQQKGRHGGARSELIPALRARARMDGIAERAEFVDIAAQSTAGDFKAIGEIGPGPVPAALKQREQPEKPGGCFQHKSSLTVTED
jgi:hypothetical protein